MKWLSIIITILEYVIPALAKKGKDKLSQELNVAEQAIKVLTSDMNVGAKMYALDKAVGNLKAVQNFKIRVCKQLDRAKDRLYKKLF